MCMPPACGVVRPMKTIELRLGGLLTDEIFLKLSNSFPWKIVYMHPLYHLRLKPHYLTRKKEAASRLFFLSSVFFFFFLFLNKKKKKNRNKKQHAKIKIGPVALQHKHCAVKIISLKSVEFNLDTRGYIQSTLFIPTFDITIKFDITIFWMERFLSSRSGRILVIFKNAVFNIPMNMCCGYLLELPRRGDSNKYPQHLFLGVNKG